MDTTWLTATPPAEIVGDDLALRRVGPDDVPALTDSVLASLAELREFMPWAVEGYSTVDATAFASDAVSAWEERRAFTYVVHELSAPGVVAGTTGLMNRLRPGALEIGYWVRTSCTGRRIARRSTVLLLEACSALAGLEQVEIHHDEANLASRSVPAALGFTLLDTVVVPIDAPGKTGRLTRWRRSVARRSQVPPPPPG